MPEIECTQVLVLAATAKEFRRRSKPIETSQYRKCAPKEDAKCSQLHENNSINQPWERKQIDSCRLSNMHHTNIIEVLQGTEYPCVWVPLFGSLLQTHS